MIYEQFLPILETSHQTIRNYMLKKYSPRKGSYLTGAAGGGLLGAGMGAVGGLIDAKKQTKDIEDPKERKKAIAKIVAKDTAAGGAGGIIGGLIGTHLYNKDVHKRAVRDATDRYRVNQDVIDMSNQLRSLRKQNNGKLPDDMENQLAKVKSLTRSLDKIRFK